MNILTNTTERLCEIEKLGIYLDEIRITDRFKLMDEDPMTITGLSRPAGEYFCASIDVLIAVDQPADEIETLKTQLKEYPEVQETFTVCKKATKAEYMEEYIPKKSLKKVVKKAKP